MRSTKIKRTGEWHEGGLNTFIKTNHTPRDNFLEEYRDPWDLIPHVTMIRILDFRGIRASTISRSREQARLIFFFVE
jgi:hypothetical protein